MDTDTTVDSTPEELYRLGQQHASEDAAALARDWYGRTGNVKFRDLADAIESGRHTRRAANRRTE